MKNFSTRFAFTGGISNMAFSSNHISNYAKTKASHCYSRKQIVVDSAYNYRAKTCKFSK